MVKNHSLVMNKKIKSEIGETVGQAKREKKQSRERLAKK